MRYRIEETIMPIELFDAEGNPLTEAEALEALGQTGDKPGWRKNLEEDARLGKEAVKSAAEAQARADAAERKAALIEAGVDLNTPLGKYFAENYKGEATVDAVKDAAGVIGLIPVSTTPAVKAEAAALDRIAGASTSTSAPDPDLDEMAQIDAFDIRGDGKAFDAFVKKLGVTVDRGDMGAKWDSPYAREVTTPAK